MNNPNDVVQNKHLDALAARIAGNIGGVDFVGATASLGGASGLVPAPNAGDNEKFLRGDGTWVLPTFILGTTPSTVNGGLWYELDSNEAPTLRMRYGNKIYAFASSWNSNAQPSAPSVVTPDTPDTPDTQTGYGLYDSNDNLLATLDETAVQKISLEQADQLEGTEDYETLLQYADDYQDQADGYGKTLAEVFWFTIPEDYWLNEGDYLKYEFTCAGENVEVYANGNQMQYVHVDGNEYYAKLTEFGAVAIMVDA